MPADQVSIGASKVGGRIDISDELKRYLSEALKRWADGPVTVTVKRERPGKSHLQLGYYNALVLPMIVEEICDDPENEEELARVHVEMKCRFLPMERATFTDRESGEERTVEAVPSLADLNTKQMAEFVDRVRQWAGEFLGLTIPDPDPLWKTKREER